MTVVELNQEALDFAGKTGKLLIDGEWVEAASGRTLETLTRRLERVLDGSPRARPRTSSSPWVPLVGALTTRAQIGAG